MSLPTSRPRTYVMGMPAIPDDFNEIMDAIIDAKHPLLTLTLPITGFVLSSTAAAAVSFAHGAPTAYAATMVCAAVPVGATLSITIPKGTRVVNLRVVLKDASGQPPLVTRVCVGDKAGSRATISTVNSAASGATQTLSHLGIDYSMATADGDLSLLLTTATNATGTYEVYAVEVDIDRL